jgi:hypothetical protein
MMAGDYAGFAVRERPPAIEDLQSGVAFVAMPTATIDPTGYNKGTRIPQEHFLPHECLSDYP